MQLGYSFTEGLSPKCRRPSRASALQENVANTFAAFSSSSDKGFASPEEFEMRVEVFKENIIQLADLNTNLSDYIVSCPCVRAGDAMLQLHGLQQPLLTGAAGGGQ